MKLVSPDRNGSRRGFLNNAFFILLILLVALVSGQDEYSQADLEAMTEAELEDICIKRGFQLVNEDSDELTKQDYVEAAQRCLAIEQEMNELLTQYPELADELEEEIKRMERENAEKQAIVDGLENQISDDAEKGRPAPGTAFHREAILEDEENNHAVGSGVGDDELEISEETLVDEVVVDSMSGEETTLHDTTLTDEEKSSGSQTETNLDEAQDDDFVDTQTVTDATPDAGTQIEAPNNSAGKEDLTMTNLAIESLRVLVKNAKDDVRRIINLAIPVLQPLLNAGDVAWQQMKSLFLRAREAYEAYQATNTAPIEGSEVADTCDDSIPA